MFEDIFLSIPFIIFLIITLFYAVIYYDNILKIKKEYSSAKYLIKNIISEYKKRLEENNKKINKLLYKFEVVYSQNEKNNIYINNLNKQANTYLDILSSMLSLNNNIIDKMIILNKNIEELKESDNNILLQIKSFNNEFNKSLPRPVLNISDKSAYNLEKLTSTEKEIIQIILSEGSKTSPEIMKKIDKTREHTSRLMKKLWQEGYIERDTHTIPFIYRPTKELKKRITIEK